MSLLRRNSAKAQHRHPSSSSPIATFLDLPAEIRCYIYEMVLDCDTEIDLVKLTQGCGYESEVAAIAANALQQPPITQASSIIRAETLPIFYGNRTITIGLTGFCSATSIHWLSSIGTSNRKLLRRCRTYYSGALGAACPHTLAEIEFTLGWHEINAYVGDFVSLNKRMHEGYMWITFEDDAAES